MMEDEYIEITIRFHMKVDSIEVALYDSQYMGNDKRKSLLKYAKWLIEQEGLFGVVEDEFDIISARALKKD